MAFTTVSTNGELNAAVSALDFEEPRVGFIPTMGALHAGHLSLVKRSAAENDVTIVSIFVNPLQFGPHEDFTRYPRTLSHDRKLLQDNAADILFLPEATAMYPELADERGTGSLFPSMVTVKAGPLGDRFEGKARPGHFDGVLTVVAKLFQLCNPRASRRFTAYFGQKDAQQAFLVRKMVRDLNFPVAVEVAETVRMPLPQQIVDAYPSPAKAYEEIPGLALSSRNRYLSLRESEAALVISRSLKAAYTSYAKTRRIDLNPSLNLISDEKHVDLDYFEVVDATTFTALERTQDNVISPGALASHVGGILAVAAVRIGKTRLIDNLWIIEAPSKLG